MLPRSTSAMPAILLIPSVTLFIAWVWARMTRPGMPEGLDVNLSGAGGGGGGGGRVDGMARMDPSRFGWPAWYGASTSPFDYTPPSRLASELEESDGKIKVLVDVAGLSADSLSIPYAMALLAALRSNDSADIYPGDRAQGSEADDADEADDGSSLAWEEVCKGYDLIWRLREADGVEKGGWKACEGVPIVSETLDALDGSGSLSRHVVSDPTANIHILAQPADMLSQSSRYEALKLQYGDDWQMGLLAHVLPAADASIYYPQRKIKSRRAVTYFASHTTASLPKQERPKLPYDSRWNEVYPTLMPAKVLASVRVEGDDDVGAILDVRPKGKGKGKDKGGSQARDWVRKEEKKRSERMRQSGICLFDSWKDGLNEDMVQAMLSGCVVAAVVPDVKRDPIASLILPLSSNSPLDDPGTLPIKQLEHILRITTTAELDKKALRAFAFARRELVLRRKVEDVRGLREVWVRGGRGYQFTSGFKWTCSSPGLGGERPPWCSD